MDNLKTCLFGGYDKLDTLKYIDSLTGEIYMLESALSKKKNGDRFVVPAETEKRKLKNATLGGFSKQDVDLYLGELTNKISELRAKL